MELTEARRQGNSGGQQGHGRPGPAGAVCRLPDLGRRPCRHLPANLERELTFLGLAGMIDPVRPEVKDAIAQCRSAGIRPIMITGDHVDTAMAIARELGILEPAAAAPSLAPQLDDMTEEEFEREFRNIPSMPGSSRA